LKGASQPAAFELTLEHFAVCLREQEVVGIVALKDVEEQAARRLELSRCLS
jgi:hypothetical protein